MWYFYLFNGLFCIWMAHKDAYYVKINRPDKIKHWQNGLIHILFAGAMWWLYGWPHFFAVLCESRIVFDIAMNLFRGLNPFYVSPSPKSIIDKIEKKIFHNNGFYPKLVYLITFILIVWLT